MKHFLPLLILTGLLFGQDVLTLKNGEFYKGEYDKIEDGNVFFKPEGAYVGFQPVKINKIKTLELSDGRLLIRDGRKSISRNEYQAL